MLFFIFIMKKARNIKTEIDDFGHAVRDISQ